MDAGSEVVEGCLEQQGANARVLLMQTRPLDCVLRWMVLESQLYLSLDRRYAGNDALY